MFLDDLTIKSNGIPVLKRDEIDTLAEQILFKTMPDLLKTPTPLDTDAFAEFKLGLNVAFYHLSHCGLYLGMFVFNDTSKIPIFRPELNRAEYLNVSADTIIIEQALLGEKSLYRYRFTMMHECAHALLHHRYFSYDPNQLTLFEHEPMIQCREIQYSLKENRSWSVKEIMEWQANTLAAALLMPKCMVIKVVNDLKMNRRLETSSCLISKLQSVFQVSEPAARYRLSHLGLI